MPGRDGVANRARNILTMLDISDNTAARKRVDAAAPHSAQEFRDPRAIIIPPRHRKDLGDIPALARSIQEYGLLHPIVIRPDGTLIAGARRLAAVDLLGWTEISVTIIPIADVVRAEAAENFDRKDFTLSEAVAIKREIEPEIKAAARDRIVAGGKQKSTAPAKLAGAATGTTRTTLAKAETIVMAAEAEPEKFGKLVEAMDRTGRVNGPYKRLQNLKASDAIKAEPPPLPMNGPYRSGMVDWPWASEPDDRNSDHGARGYYPYPTMVAERSVEFPMVSILHPNSSVWLWITNFHLLRGDHLIFAKAWGLNPVALFTWVKRKWGQGHRARGATEHLIQMVRGDVLCLGGDTKTWFEGEGGVHSQKPQEVYAIIEKLSPAPRYFELFSRGGPRENWDLHGNDIGNNAVEPNPACATFEQNGPRPPSDSIETNQTDIPKFLKRRPDNQLAFPELRE